MRIVTAVVTSRWLPAAALASVVLLDVVARSRYWGIAGTGILDEPAHLATALLVLLAVAGPGRLLARPRFTVAALVGAVAIDLDHVPLYAGAAVAVDGGRPFTHCLLTAVVLAAAGVAVARFRPVLLGLATGVLLHLLRDVPTGPGVSLFFPVWSERIEMPYRIYLVVLALSAAVATGRAALEHRSARAGAEGSRGATIGR